jgi:hypothetical protein
VSPNTAPEDFLDERILQGIQDDWRGQLNDFVRDLPPYEECLPILESLVEEVVPR